MKKIFFSLFAIMSIFMVGCQKNDDIGQSSASYSGEELFRGIFLLEGVVSEKISTQAPIIKEIRKTLHEHPDLLNEFQKRNTELITKIRELDPAFFNDLKIAIQSKNVKQLEYQLVRGNKLISVVILPEFYKTEYASVVKDIVASVDIRKYNITTNQGLEAYLTAVQNKIDKLPQSIKPKELASNSVVGRCLAVALVGVFAVVALDAVAIVNAALLVNVGAAVNVYVAVNVATAYNYNYHYGGSGGNESGNVQTHDGQGNEWIPEANISTFGHEKRIQEIFDIFKAN